MCQRQKKIPLGPGREGASGPLPLLNKELISKTSGQAVRRLRISQFGKGIVRYEHILFSSKKRPGLAVATGLAISLAGVGAP
jgi:hypothetical protein